MRLRPLGVGVSQMKKVQGAVVVSQLFKYSCTRPPAGVVRIKRSGHVALCCSILQQARITEHIAQGEMNVRTVRTPVDKVRRFLIGLDEAASFDANLHEKGASHDEIRIEGPRPLVRGLGTLHYRFASSSVARFVVIP